MALDLSCIGTTTAPVTFDLVWRDVVLYALGVGAKRTELDFLYEGHGPKVLPSFAVVPTYPALLDAMVRAGCALDKIIHGHQKVRVHGPLPSRGRFLTRATVKGIYDLRRMAQVVLTTETTDELGMALFETEWGILVLGEGGFGGDPPPAREGSAPSRDADFRVEETTSPEQALLYRLSGDTNPLHADPDHPMMERYDGRPILHGLCTYGYMTRAIAKATCNGDATRVRAISARFAKPVWPGDTLITEGWIEGDRVWSRTYSRERRDAVLTHCQAEITPAA